MHTNDCWLFLDCQVMTGNPPKKCPNRKACKQNAINSVNRVCELPYLLFPHENELFDCRTLLVKEYLPEECLLYGWATAEYINKYKLYRNGCLWVGGIDVFLGYYKLELPQELKAQGWAVAEKLPYAFYDFWVDGDSKCHYYLEVTAPNQNQQEFGWHSPIPLPYYRSLNLRLGSEFINSLFVSFAVEDPSYAEAVALGWYPPKDLVPF